MTYLKVTKTNEATLEFLFGIVIGRFLCHTPADSKFAELVLIVYIEFSLIFKTFIFFCSGFLLNFFYSILKHQNLLKCQQKIS